MNTLNAEFVTTNSKLTVKNNTIWQKKLIEAPKNYWFHSFILLSLIIGYSVYNAINFKFRDWYWVVAGLIWISPHFVTIYKILFVNTWKTNIRLRDVKEIKTEKAENELEEKVVLILKSGRQKTYIFRKSEKEAEKFAEIITAHISQPSLVLQ